MTEPQSESTIEPVDTTPPISEQTIVVCKECGVNGHDYDHNVFNGEKPQG